MSQSRIWKNLKRPVATQNRLASYEERFLWPKHCFLKNMANESLQKMESFASNFGSSASEQVSSVLEADGGEVGLICCISAQIYLKAETWRESKGGVGSLRNIKVCHLSFKSHTFPPTFWKACGNFFFIYERHPEDSPLIFYVWIKIPFFIYFYWTKSLNFFGENEPRRNIIRRKLASVNLFWRFWAWLSIQTSKGAFKYYATKSQSNFLP